MKCPTCSSSDMNTFPIRDSWGTGPVEAVYYYCQPCGELLIEERGRTNP